MKKVLFGRRTWIMIIAALVVFGGLLAVQWYGKRMMNQAMNKMAQPPVVITAGDASLASWRSSVNAVGTLVAVEGAQLATEVPGIIDSIRFDNGAPVAAGDVILTLDSKADRAELESLKAAEKLAQIELDRARTLLRQHNLSRAEVDRRQSQLDQARANVKAQQARIEQKALRAPYAGRLGIRHFNVGDYVDAGTAIIGLQALDPLFVNFTLPEQYSTIVKPGMEVTASVASVAKSGFSGKVTAVEPSVDTATRNFKVQATIENPRHELKPGMFASLTLAWGEARDRIVIPQTAISYHPYGNAVFVIDTKEGKKTVSQRFVTLGATKGDLIEITKGLEAGETVATSGLLKLQPGAAVTIDNSVTPEAKLNPAPGNG